MIGRALLLLAVWPLAPAMAEEFVYSDDAVVACLNAAEADGSAPSMCIGASAEACIETTVGGTSTVGLGTCRSQEADFWDSILNIEYQRLLAEAADFDVSTKASGLNAPDVVPELRAIQRAWITYRDARCTFEAVQWAGGTGMGPATALCFMQTTAEQALYLRAQELEAF